MSSANLGMLFARSLACFCKVLGVPHRRETPPICCLISCEAKGVVYYQVLLWEPKMCRLALQLLGMLGNVLGWPWHAFATSSACFARSLACFARSLADFGMLLQGPRSPTSKRNPPTCCLISCEDKGVVYYQASIYVEVGQGPCKACRGRCKSMPRSAEDVAKYA